MKLRIAVLFFAIGLQLVLAQDGKVVSKEISVSPLIDGTLLFTEQEESIPLAIIIAGSGPTDRNGNQNFMQNNSLKKLAESLSAEGIATFRYDKRIVKQIRQGRVDNSIIFDHFVEDARAVVKYFRKSNAFDKIYVIGHSQGSLVGLLAAEEGVDGFISLAGAGKPIDQVLIDQVNKTAPMFTEDTKRVLAVLKEGKSTSDYPQALSSILNEDVQPFMSNWMQYDPSEIIKSLSAPALIINGTKDLQVSEEEAKLLHQASPKSELVIIENMNHILVPIEGGDLENSKSYNEAYRKISPELIASISGFILD